MIFWYEDTIFCHSPFFISHCRDGYGEYYRVTRKEDFDIIWIKSIYANKWDILLVFFKRICYEFFIKKKNIFSVEVFHTSVCYRCVDTFIKSFYKYLRRTDKKIWRIEYDIYTRSDKKESNISQIVFLIRCDISGYLDLILDISRKWRKPLAVLSKNIPFSPCSFWKTIPEEVFLIFFFLSRSAKFPIFILFYEITDFRERDHIDYREIVWERGYLQWIVDFSLCEGVYMGFFWEKNLSRFSFEHVLRKEQESVEDLFLHIGMILKYQRTHSRHLRPRLSRWSSRKDGVVVVRMRVYLLLHRYGVHQRVVFVGYSWVKKVRISAISINKKYKKETFTRYIFLDHFWVPLQNYILVQKVRIWASMHGAIVLWVQIFQKHLYSYFHFHILYHQGSDTLSKRDELGFGAYDPWGDLPQEVYIYQQKIIYW